MGRRAQGHRVRWKRGWAFVAFTHAGERYRIALGTRDPGEASSRAAHEHAAVVSGRRRSVARPVVGGVVLGLDELLAEWIASLEGALDETTRATLEIYARHYLAFFGTLARMTDASCADYGRARLRRVLRKTVQKELSYLRGFFDWCVEQGALVASPKVAALPKKATGKRSGKQRSKPVEIVEAQALEIIGHLPVTSKRIGDRAWPIRARFMVAWETALRPTTLAQLSAPANYRRGSRELVLDDADDKARYGRSVPLSVEARRALDLVAPDAGLLFGQHNFNKHLKRAAAKVLGAEIAKSFAAYDFRHGRGSHLADEGAPLTGIAFLLGHKRLSTTDRYLRGNRKAAERALEAVAIAAPYGPPAPPDEEPFFAATEDLRGDRRVLNPRHLEPQRSGDDDSVEESAEPPGAIERRTERLSASIGPRGQNSARPPAWVIEATANLACLLAGVA